VGKLETPPRLTGGEALARGCWIQFGGNKMSTIAHKMGYGSHPKVRVRKDSLAYRFVNLLKTIYRLLTIGGKLDI